MAVARISCKKTYLLAKETTYVRSIQHFQLAFGVGAAPALRYRRSPAWRHASRSRLLQLGSVRPRIHTHSARLFSTMKSASEAVNSQTSHALMPGSRTTDMQPLLPCLTSSPEANHGRSQMISHLSIDGWGVIRAKTGAHFPKRRLWPPSGSSSYPPRNRSGQKDSLYLDGSTRRSCHTAITLAPSTGPWKRAIERLRITFATR